MPSKSRHSSASRSKPERKTKKKKLTQRRTELRRIIAPWPMFSMINPMGSASFNTFNEPRSQTFTRSGSISSLTYPHLPDSPWDSDSGDDDDPSPTKPSPRSPYIIQRSFSLPIPPPRDIKSEVKVTDFVQPTSTYYQNTPRSATAIYPEMQTGRPRPMPAVSPPQFRTRQSPVFKPQPSVFGTAQRPIPVRSPSPRSMSTSALI